MLYSGAFTNYSMGTQIIRNRGDKTYLYYAYYQGKTRKEIYCGLEGDRKAEQKARECEIEELQMEKEKILVRIKELKKK